MKCDGHTKTRTNITTIILGWNPRLCQVKDADGFGREAFIRCAQNFKVCEAAIFLHHET